MMTLEPVRLQPAATEAYHFDDNSPSELSGVVPEMQPYLGIVTGPQSTPPSEQSETQNSPALRKPLDYPDRQRQSFGAVELSDHPLLKGRRRLPIQVLQEMLTMEERAAVYTAHCLPWLFTTPMIEAGWRDPQRVLDNYKLKNRAELIAFVQHQIMPRVVEEIVMAELDDRAFSDPAALLGIAPASPRL